MAVLLPVAGAAEAPKPPKVVDVVAAGLPNMDLAVTVAVAGDPNTGALVAGVCAGFAPKLNAGLDVSAGFDAPAKLKADVVLAAADPKIEAPADAVAADPKLGTTFAPAAG